jgi:hypothetical protein
MTDEQKAAYSVVVPASGLAINEVVDLMHECETTIISTRSACHKICHRPYVILPHDVLALRPRSTVAYTTLGIDFTLDLVLARLGLARQSGRPLYPNTLA